MTYPRMCSEGCHLALRKGRSHRTNMAAFHRDAFTSFRWLCQRVPFRTIVTESIEPSSASSIPERPCTVVLAQDGSLYENSWQEPFSQVLPNKRGLHYCNLLLDARSLHKGLDLLEQDLASMPNVVLITRGPIVSMIAQYYLESLPLAGLVMVDPILYPFPKLEFKRGSMQEAFMKEIFAGKETRPLKLEPGVVPMLVFRSLLDPTFKDAAGAVALRHSDPDGAYGKIPVHDISVTDEAALTVIDIVSNWIDDCVL